MDLDIDEIERIAEAGDANGHATTCVTVLTLVEEVRELRARLEVDPRHSIDGIDARDETIWQLENQVKHWKSNHDNQVTRARFLIERGDIPVERVRAYERMAALQAFHDFFRDRCEGLFMQFGMAAVDAYNNAARGAK